MNVIVGRDILIIVNNYGNMIGVGIGVDYVNFEVKNGNFIVNNNGLKSIGIVNVDIRVNEVNLIFNMSCVDGMVICEVNIMILMGNINVNVILMNRGIVIR